MRFFRYCALAAVLATVPATAWTAEEQSGVKPETASMYRAARDQVERLSGTKAAKYAPEAVEQAKTTINAAQRGIESGDEKAARNSTEAASLQTKIALALADERMAAEKTDATRKELAALEKRLTTILSGKGEQP